MAYKFTVADSDFIHWGNGLTFENNDYSVFLRFHGDSTTDTGYLCGNWVGNTGWGLRRQNNGLNLTWFQNLIDSGNTETAVSALGTNQWHNIILTFDDSGADDTCTATGYVNNSQVLQSTTADRTDASTANYGIGNRDALDRDSGCIFSEHAVWIGTILTAGQRAMLEAGFSPLQIGTLPTLYTPMDGKIIDIVGGLAGTNVNTAVVGDKEARMYKPKIPAISEASPGTSPLVLYTVPGLSVTNP
jgi:hypothetical protein